MWEFPDKIKGLQKTKTELLGKIQPVESLLDKITGLENSINILNDEEGEILFEDFKKEIDNIKKDFEDMELLLLLSGEVDRNNAIISIHPGAGGVESQDWAQMLMRIYLRWAETHGFKTGIVDLQPGEEAGIKGVTFTVEGPYAYGYLKGEAGVHRLVRISPFDANKRRHTSFSAVIVYPEIEDTVAVDVRDEDLRVDTFRASGAGGQHVNKVSSAVRIVHIPTGIVVSSQSERSQHKNRSLAMKILKSRLYDISIREREEKIETFAGDKKEISWGNQIRSYVLQPYRLVKDHRTNLEVGNVDSVLNGNLDVFIKSYLKMMASLKSA